MGGVEAYPFPGSNPGCQHNKRDLMKLRIYLNNFEILPAIWRFPYDGSWTDSQARFYGHTWAFTVAWLWWELECSGTPHKRRKDKMQKLQKLGTIQCNVGEEMEKVFLGGTCNESTWRDQIISMLNIGYFNPVVDDWTEDCMTEEILQREECDFCLYVITPKMTGVYSIAEAVDDSNKRPDRTIFVLLKNDENLFFTEGQWRSLKQVARMVADNGGRTFYDLESVADYLNSTLTNNSSGEETWK